MISGIIIGFGIGLIINGLIIAGFQDDKRYLIISIIGAIMIIIGIGVMITNDIDCRNHCQCEGKFHSYDMNKDVCNCLSMPKEFADCKDKCERREPFYNQYTGRCYCT